MPVTTQYTPSGGGALAFQLLIDPPTRETRQTVSERVIPGTTDAIVDVIGKAVTKILGIGRFDSYASLTTFEGAVGTDGVLIYSEEPTGIDVLFVALERNRVLRNDVHLAGVEFWIVS